jgi:tetratricopeptide (TPR) repeat protein/SAM-dependent methyltransferase
MIASNNSRLFISYARVDGGEFASGLQGRLAAAGFPTWFDAVDIPAGSDWDKEIDKGLQAAGAVLVVLTPGAVLSTQVKGEWCYALNRLLPVIPLLARDCDVPRVLSVLQYLDFRIHPEAAFARLINRLCDLPSDHLAELVRLRDAFHAARGEGPEVARFDAKVAELEAVIDGWEDRIQAQRDRIIQGLERPLQSLAEAGRFGSRKTRVAGTRPLDVSDIFKGRDGEQQAVGRLLAGGQARLVSILGRGGMGKTALACHVLRGIEQGRWPHADRGPMIEGIAYLSTRTENGITLERLFLDCARLLGSRFLEKVWADPGLDADAKITRLLETFDRRPYIILLDNFEDMLDGDGRLSDLELASFLGRVLGSPGHGLRILVTSRVALQLSPALQHHDHHVALVDGLSIHEGIQLLRELDLNNEWGVGNAPEAKLAEVVRRTHGVPRALELVVATMADNVFLTLDDVVCDFYTQDEVVRRLVEENYRLLNDAARRVVEALAVYAVPVPPVALDYLLERSAPGLDLPTVFRQLKRSHLVHVDRLNRTATLHPIDQEYLYERLPEKGQYSRQALHARAAEYYGRRCAAGPVDDNEAIELLSHQFNHLRKANQFEEAAELLGELSWIVFRGSASNAQDMIRSLTGRVTGDRGQLGLLRCELAVRNMLGPLDEALAIGERARELARRLGAVRQEAQIETVLGNVCRYLANTARAIDHFGKALELSRQAGDAEAEGSQLGNLGLCYSYVGNVREALRYGGLLLERAEQLGSAHDRLSAHDVLALAYFVWGRWDEAIRHCEAALQTWQKGMHDGRAYVFNTAGLAHFLAGREEKAQAILRQGRAVASELESPRAEGFCLRNLGLVEYLAGSVEGARGPATEAHAILSRLGLASVSAPALAVLDAAASGDREDEPRALLECAERSANNPDLLPASVLAARARDLASASGLGALADQARVWLNKHSARLVLPEERRRTEETMDADFLDRVSRSYAEHPLTQATILRRIRRRRGSVQELTEMDLAVDDETRVTDQNHLGGAGAVLAIAKAVGLRAEHCVLDVGTGLGGTPRLLAHLYGCRCHGVELTSQRCRDAVELTQRVGLEGRVTFSCGDFLEMEITGNPFDLIIGQDSFIHFSDLGRLLAKCVSLLQPAGWLAVQDGYLRREPSNAEEERRLQALLGCWNGCFHTVATWVASMATAGLEVKQFEDFSGPCHRELSEQVRLAEEGQQDSVTESELLGWRLGVELSASGLLGTMRLLAVPVQAGKTPRVDCAREPFAENDRGGSEQTVPV